MATMRKAAPEEAERLALGLDDQPRERLRPPVRPWEPWEIGYLKAFIDVDPLPDIAKNLGRTVLAVRQQANLRGFRGARRPNPAPEPPAADELAALRDAYAWLERREQQAREQVARLVGELDQLKARPPAAPAPPAVQPARPAPVAKTATPAVTDAALRAEVERLWIYLAVTLHMVGATKAARHLGVSQEALQRAMVRAGVAGAALVEPGLAAKGGGA